MRCSSFSSASFSGASFRRTRWAVLVAVALAGCGAAPLRVAPFEPANTAYGYGLTPGAGASGWSGYSGVAPGPIESPPAVPPPRPVAVPSVSTAPAQPQPPPVDRAFVLSPPFDGFGWGRGTLRLHRAHHR